jgi:phage repressor protein C with HTH and peptisase S24 domain
MRRCGSDVVTVNPHVEATANDYVVVINDEEEATFKQWRPEAPRSDNRAF